jgi:putative redox protein
VMQAMVVRSLGGDRYVAQVRGHELIVDQPVDAGGTDLGPTPVELFVASLAACVAHYAGSFLARHHICRDGFHVDASWQMAEDRPARVAAVSLRVIPPPALPPERLSALLAVARACTVHNSLERAPGVSIEVAEAKVPPGVAADVSRLSQEHREMARTVGGTREWPAAGASPVRRRGKSTAVRDQTCSVTQTALRRAQVERAPSGRSASSAAINR